MIEFNGLHSPLMNLTVDERKLLQLLYFGPIQLISPNLEWRRYGPFICTLAISQNGHEEKEPSSKAGQHVAYIPPLPDSLQDMLASWHPKWETQKKHLLTHCHCELMHAIWRILLDNDFLHAYTYGIVIKCHDGVKQHVYPRIFTYSADYLEK
jgi:hypothetical protein